MRAFHDDPQVKARYLARVRAHRAADEIIHGTYWHKGKGCAVGCTLHSRDHSDYETELGIPIALAYLEDGIFERLRAPHDLSWPEEFLRAIPVGADLTDVCRLFLLALLSDPEHGVLRHVVAPQWIQQNTSIQQVIDFLGTTESARAAGWAAGAAERAAEAARATGGERAAAWAARVAARAAAWAARAAESTTWAIEAAAWAADSAARAAVWAAEAARATGAARWQSAVLLSILAEAPRDKEPF